MGGTLAPLSFADAADLDGGERFYDRETRSRDAGNILTDVVRVTVRLAT
jgi:hypothetical protein